MPVAAGWPVFPVCSAGLPNIPVAAGWPVVGLLNIDIEPVDAGCPVVPCPGLVDEIPVIGCPPVLFPNKVLLFAKLVEAVLLSLLPKVLVVWFCSLTG